MARLAAAVLTIRDASDMSIGGKKRIYKWLLKQARAFKKEGHLYAKNFRARYLYEA